MLMVEGEEVMPRIYDKNLLDNVMNGEHRELIKGKLKSLLDPPEEEEQGEEEMEEMEDETATPAAAAAADSTPTEQTAKPIRGF